MSTPHDDDEFEPTHVVIGPLAIVPLPGGRQVYLYKDAPLPDVPEETVEHLIDAGLVRRIDEESADEPELPPQEAIKEIIARQPDRVEQTDRSDGDVERSMPSRTASKGTWVAYAVDQGMPTDEAQAMTRDELADHFVRRG